jgi:hypothetical protein
MSKTNEHLYVAYDVTNAIYSLDHYLQLVADGRRAIEIAVDNDLDEDRLASLRRSVAQWEQDLLGNLLFKLRIDSDEDGVQRHITNYFPDPDVDEDDTIYVGPDGSAYLREDVEDPS